MKFFRTGAAAAVVIAAAGFTLAGQSRSPAPTAKSVATTTPRDDRQDDDDLPAAVSPADRTMILKWEEQNELCRGSSDAETIDRMCPKRDQTQDALERRGWCYGGLNESDFPPDYDWHRCSEISRSVAMADGEGGGTTSSSEPDDSGSGRLIGEANRDNLRARGLRLGGALDLDQSRQRRIEDARAMVRETWASYEPAIISIVIGSKCGVYGDPSANIAIRKLQIAMQDALISAGLIGDPTMSIEQVTANYVKEGNKAVQGGACARLDDSFLRSLHAAGELLR